MSVAFSEFVQILIISAFFVAFAEKLLFSVITTQRISPASIGGGGYSLVQ